MGLLVEYVGTRKIRAHPKGHLAQITLVRGILQSSH